MGKLRKISTQEVSGCNQCVTTRHVNVAVVSPPESSSSRLTPQETGRMHVVNSSVPTRNSSNDQKCTQIKNNAYFSGMIQDMSYISRYNGREKSSYLLWV